MRKKKSIFKGNKEDEKGPAQRAHSYSQKEKKKDYSSRNKRKFVEKKKEEDQK